MAQRTETKVRLPDELHAALTAEASRRGVSLNALVTIILTEWVGSTARLRERIGLAQREGGDDGS